ncbi:hypothetical protein ACQPTN_03790 [Bradyrhizobium sp. 13971]
MEHLPAELARLDLDDLGARADDGLAQLIETRNWPPLERRETRRQNHPHNSKIKRSAIYSNFQSSSVKPKAPLYKVQPAGAMNRSRRRHADWTHLPKVGRNQ